MLLGNCLSLQTVHVPLKLKYGCPQPEVWKSSVDALLLVLETALPSLLASPRRDDEFWSELAAILEDFLFNEVYAVQYNNYVVCMIRIITAYIIT